jgi:hypothetical protein
MLGEKLRWHRECTSNMAVTSRCLQVGAIRATMVHTWVMVGAKQASYQGTLGDTSVTIRGTTSSAPCTRAFRMTTVMNVLLP